MTDKEKLDRAEAAAAHAAIEAFTNTFAKALELQGIENPLTLMAGTTHVHHSLAMEQGDQLVVQFVVRFIKDEALVEKILSTVRKIGTA